MSTGGEHVKCTIERTVPVVRTGRVMQLEGMFDVPPTKQASHRWDIEFTLPTAWNIGLIVGPSGCGKSTLANHIWPDKVVQTWPWSHDKAVIDCFPPALSIKDITHLLSSIGYSSPPGWLKPYHVLSNGEKFRVDVARTLAELPEMAVIDEFTSVVDRTVAKVASAAVQKAVRKTNRRLVVVTCHEDIAEWLEPDWIYRPAEGVYTPGRLLRRPPIQVKIERCSRDWWRLFGQYHYLSSDLTKSAHCWLATVEGRPAAFYAMIASLAGCVGWRFHRSVCHPDFQGVGIGSTCNDYIASLYASTGRKVQSITAHPAFIHFRRNSSNWREARSMSLPTGRRVTKSKTTKTLIASQKKSGSRFTASFVYVGPSRREEARHFGIVV